MSASDVRAGGAFIEITGKDKGLRNALGKARQSIKAFAGSARAAGGTILALGGALALPFILAGKAAAEQVKQEAKLEAAVRATGGASGFTADELKKQAAALQLVTTFGDEAIISAQALLVTFKEIEGAQFERATEAILDLSTNLGTDLKSSAILVGKALNDPILGISALSRVGIAFTESQKETIKALVESGQAAKAQGLILTELESIVGGSARAFRDTFAGAIIAAGNALNTEIEYNIPDEIYLLKPSRFDSSCFQV